MASLSDATVKKPATKIGGTEFGIDARRDDAGEEHDFVPDLGRDNPHARPVFQGGDVLLRPQRFNMHRDTTYDALKGKPNGTLFKFYNTMEPSLRYLYNAKEYVKDLTTETESGTISPEEFVLHTERIFNTISGVYDILNRHVGLLS